MVEGLQEPLRPICVADLDGTLLKGNSMKLFMRRLPAGLWRKHHPVDAAEALLWIALRAIRSVSHRRMKWNLCRIARRSLSGEDWQRFARETLLPAIDPAVAGHISGLRANGAAVCVASAAMEEYVEPLCRLLGYEHQLSTPFTERFADYAELRGGRKLAAIRGFADAGNYRLCRFLTDHSDDLPTARAYSGETLLVNPRPASLRRFAEAGITRRL